ncbi:MAG: hypothetical protein OQL28_13115 [Sedimenticola sp.]|nr:hypothetical protein [Sedimenticola sp.]
MREFDEMQSLLSEEETRQNREVWIRLQSFLAHSAMISKLLFPVSKKRGESDDDSEKRKQRGIEVREYLGVDDDHSIKNRAARNALEHLDEKIDIWVSKNSGGLLEAVFDNREAFEYLARVSVIRRVIILDEMIFISQGIEHEETDLNIIQNAVVEVLGFAEEKIKDTPNAVCI